jgi:hypothetical protein
MTYRFKLLRIAGVENASLIGEGYVWVLRLVILVPAVLVVLEDLVEVAEPLPGQEAQRPDQTSDASSGEGASREANQEDLISRCVVEADETVRFSDILGQAHASSCGPISPCPLETTEATGECLTSTHDAIPPGVSGADPGLIVHHLW